MSISYSIKDWRETLATFARVESQTQSSPSLGFRLNLNAEAVTDLQKMISVIDALSTEEAADVSLLKEEARIDRVAEIAGCSHEFVHWTVMSYVEICEKIARTVREPTPPLVTLPPDRIK